MTVLTHIGITVSEISGATLGKKKLNIKTPEVLFILTWSVSAWTVQHVQEIVLPCRPHRPVSQEIGTFSKISPITNKLLVTKSILIFLYPVSNASPFLHPFLRRHPEMVTSFRTRSSQQTAP